ncbi:MAG: hypothetical protein RID94_11795 [Miltoncostaeaceae bacterium]
MVAALAAMALGWPGGAAAEPAAVERYRTTDAALQATTAELAMVRTRARALAGPALAANRRREAALDRRKARLLARADTELADAEGALVLLAEERRAAAKARRAAERAARQAESIPAAPAPVGVPITPLPAAAAAPANADDTALAASLDGYLASKSSPLTGLGADFVASSRAVGLDPRVLVAIAGAETSFGTYGPSQGIHNPFGMGPGIVYPSWSAGIDAAARNLGGSLYLGDGLVTLPAIQARWAPNGAGNDPTGLNSHWTRNVSFYLAEMGGDPAAPVFSAAAPAIAPGPTAMAVPAPAAPAAEAATPTPGDPVGGTPPPPATPEDGTGVPAPGGSEGLIGRVLDPGGLEAPIVDAAPGWGRPSR